jgi:WD40 repeat protein
MVAHPQPDYTSICLLQIPNVECLCIAFVEDGKSIISGWSDGKIRAFGPQTGKLLYTITDAHVHGVTAIVGTSDSSKIVSGGKEGQVRVWGIATVLNYSRFRQIACEPRNDEDVYGLLRVVGTSDSPMLVSGGKEEQVWFHCGILPCMLVFVL